MAQGDPALSLAAFKIPCRIKVHDTLSRDASGSVIDDCALQTACGSSWRIRHTLSPRRSAEGKF